VLEGLDIRMRKRAFRLQVSCRRGEDSVDKDRRDFLEVGVIREQNFFDVGSFDWFDVIDLIDLIALIELIDLIDLIDLIGLIGLIDVIGLM
jgi:hypothetical protein